MKSIIKLFYAFTIILGTSIGVSYTHEDSYLILTPHQWKYSFDQTILVDFLDDSDPAVFLNINLVNAENSNFSYNFTPLVNKPFRIIKFKIPDNYPVGYYNLTVTGIDSTDSARFVNFTKDIYYNKPNSGIYVLTDKPTYRAKEKVQIHVVGIDGTLKPITGPNNKYTVTIKDPNDNKIDQYVNETFKNGLIDHISFELTSRPTLGTWRILVESETQVYHVAYFRVEEYVLPKYEVTMDLPPYVTKNTKSISGVIRAKYTHGKKVEGFVKVTLERKKSYYYYSINEQEKITFEPFKEVELINGEAKFTFDTEISSSVSGIEISANVVDKQSLETVTKVKTIDLYDDEMYATVEPKTFELNQLNKFKISIKNPVEKPIPFKSLMLDVQELYDNDDVVNINNLRLVTDMDGVVYYETNVTSKLINILIKVSYASEPNEFEYISIEPAKPEPVKQVVGKELIISVSEDTLRTDTIGIVSVKLNKTNKYKIENKCYKARYLIISRSVIHSAEKFDLCDGEHTLNIKWNTFNSPSSTLVVYFLNENKKLIVEKKELEIKGYYNNKLELEFDRKVAEPGQMVNLKVNTSANSTVSLCVIDQSVLLYLKSTYKLNKITDDEIHSLLNSFKLYAYSPYSSNKYECFRGRWCSEKINWEGPEAQSTLEASGLIVFSDLNHLKLHKKYEKSTRMFAEYSMKQGMAHAESYEMATVDSSAGSERKYVEPTNIRTNFNETWLWRKIIVGSSGQEIISSNIPDTITSWVASGVSLHPDLGIAISNEAQIVGFKGFFVTMHLPPSIIRGEILILRVVVSNYLDKDLENVLVSLVKTDDYKQVVLLNEVDQAEYKLITEDLKLTIPLIKAQSTDSVSFTIAPVNLGSLPITVKAQSVLAADAERKELLVKPEGVEITYNMPLFIDLRQQVSIYHRFEIDLPGSMIKDSQYCMIQIVGDLLSSPLKNLNKLINKPYGCGEQNMLSLTPNIYALQYLFSKDIATLNSYEKSLVISAKENIKHGYFNQLNYMHKDGSFSAFGNSDSKGSTWLTAFVIKSFCQAQKYAQNTIDSSIIRNSITWLIQQQNIDGSFEEQGEVIDKEMQGGVDSRLTVSAYATIALIESKLNQDDVHEAIEKSLNYLKSEYNRIQDSSVYSIALLTYVFNLVDPKSQISEQSFQRFNKLASNDIIGELYWKMKSTNKTYYKFYMRETPSVDIEITSYGILIYLLKEKVAESIPIIRWLVAKSNSFGGYSSTQNTILALEALSKFNIKLNKDSTNNNEVLNILIKVETDSNGDGAIEEKQYRINQQNSLIVQSLELLSCPNVINLDIKGWGIGSVQAVVKYNIPEQIEEINQNESSSFYLDQAVQKGISYNELLMVTCVNFNSTDDDMTGMIVIESTLIAGYITNKADLDNLVKSGKIPSLRMAEIISKENKVAFYLNSMKKFQIVCIDWKIYREYPILNLKPVPVTVYDYYRPHIKKTIMFKPRNELNLNSIRSICDYSNEIEECKKN